MTRLPALPSLSSMSGLGRMPTQRRRRDELTEEERKSLIRQTGEVMLGGIAGLGNLLDLPGSSVRDVIGGQNPFDQWATPFSAENRLLGRDLLRQNKAIGDKNTWGNFLGGLALEIGTDPLTYMTLGASALSKAGKLGKTAGVLDDVAEVATQKFGQRLTKTGSKDIGRREALRRLTIDDLAKSDISGPKLRKWAQERNVDLSKYADQPLGKPIGFGLPFRDPTWVAGSEGLARGMDLIAEGIRHGKYSPVRPVANVFSRVGKDMGSVPGQKEAATVTRAEREAVVTARKKVAKGALEIEKSRFFDPDHIAKANNLTPEAAFARVSARADSMLGYLEGRTASLPTEMQFMQPHLDEMKSTLQEILEEEQSWGLASHQLQDPAGIDYFPRLRATLGVDKGHSGSTLFDTTVPGHKARKEILTGHTGGTSVLKDLSLDSSISGLAHRDKRGGRLREGDLEYVVSRLQQVPGLFHPGMEPKRGDWNALARWVANLDPKHADLGIPIYEVNPYKPLLARLESGHRAIEGIKGAVRMLKKYADVDVDGPVVNLQNVVDQFRKRTNVDGDAFHLRLADELGVAPEELQNMLVPAEVAHDATRFLTSFTSDGALKALGEGFDKLTNLFKSSVTTIFPAFHSRNLISGMYQNWVGDAFDAGDLYQAGRLIGGLEVRGLPRWLGSTDAARTAKLQQLAFAHDVLPQHAGLASDTLGDALKAQLSIPGTKPILTPAPAGSTLLQRWNPWNAAGVGSNVDTFTPFRLGRDVGHAVEGLNRLQPFITLIKKGVDPAEAASRIRAMQVDYSARAPIDRYMRRFFPFWSFTRGALPFHVEQLVARPQGKLGRTITTAGHSHDPHEITPEYVAETVSIPRGTKPDGSESYLTGLGLMFEDPLSFLGKGVGGGLREAASRLNPAFKAPLEWATGQSLFQSGPLGGRPLEEMDPPLGRTIANIRQLVTGEETPYPKPFGGRGFEFAVANSPLARLATSARQLTDTRKTPVEKLLNLGTGIKVTDVSPQKQKAILAERAESVLKKLGARDFRKIYIPQDTLESLPPQKRLLAEQLNALMQEQSLR